jgi:hypothetical protein
MPSPFKNGRLNFGTRAKMDLLYHGTTDLVTQQNFVCSILFGVRCHASCAGNLDTVTQDLHILLVRDL